MAHPVSHLSKVYRRVLVALAVGSGTIAACIFILIVTDVLMRSAGFQPWSYTTPLVEYGLMWFTLLAAPWLARTRGHVYIDSVTGLLPAAGQYVAGKISSAISVACCGAFAYYSLLRLLEAVSTGQIDSRGEDMPLWILFLPMPICFGLMTVEFGRYLVGIDSLVTDRTKIRESV